MNMYSDYIKEREGKDIFECPKGFAVYKINPDKTCYIEHIYVTPEHRDNQVASAICDAVAGRAKEAGCIELFGTVLVGSKDDTHSLKVQLAHGFTLAGVEGKMLILSKGV